MEESVTWHSLTRHKLEGSYEKKTRKTIILKAKNTKTNKRTDGRARWRPPQDEPPATVSLDPKRRMIDDESQGGFRACHTRLSVSRVDTVLRSIPIGGEENWAGPLVLINDVCVCVCV